LQTEREIETPIHPSKTSIGVDVGIAKLATLSDGSIFPEQKPRDGVCGRIAN
jgi:putative transposase